MQQRGCLAVKGCPAVAEIQAQATIDEVSDGSPAQTAGLRIGDQICRFGPVSLQDGHGPEKPWIFFCFAYIDVSCAAPPPASRLGHGRLDGVFQCYS